MKSHTPTVLIYARGTSPKDVNEHLKNCLTFCEKILRYRWIDDRHRRKAVVDTHDPGTDRSVLVHRRRSDDTGIRIERDWSRQPQQTGRRRALDLLEEFGDQLDFVVDTVESIARNRKHVDELIEFLSNGITVHVVRDATTLRAPTDAARALLEIGAGLLTPEKEQVEPPEPISPGEIEPVELEFADPAAPADTDAVQSATQKANGGDVDATPGDEGCAGIDSGESTEFRFPVRRPYSGGRPAKGFDVSDDGSELVSNDHYRTIHTVIQAYRDGEVSQSKAADQLDCSRATIRNLAERTELYQLV